MNCLCSCVEGTDDDKRGDNKRIKLISHLCDIEEEDDESEYEAVEVTYIEEGTMSTCVEEGTYLLQGHITHAKKNCPLYGMQKSQQLIIQNFFQPNYLIETAMSEQKV